MSDKYDPTLGLEVGMRIGTATCVELTDNFAIIEDIGGPLGAGQLQSLYDGDWHQFGQPLVLPHPVDEGVSVYRYTFNNPGVGF